MNNVILHPLQLNELETLIYNQCKRAFAEMKSPPAATKDEIVTIEDAAKILHLTTATIYGLVHKKMIPVMKRRGRLYFSKFELERWITSSRQMTAEEFTQTTVDSLNRDAK